MKGLGAFVGGLLTVLLAACWPDGGTVCPAIAYGRTLVVELAGDWPGDDGRTLLVDCDGPCSEVFVEDGAPGPGPGQLTVPLSDGRAEVSWTAPRDSVGLTVLGADGTELAEVDTDLDWVRVGGSEECGGPMHATVTVPAP